MRKVCAIVISLVLLGVVFLSGKDVFPEMLDTSYMFNVNETFDCDESKICKKNDQLIISSFIYDVVKEFDYNEQIYKITIDSAFDNYSATTLCDSKKIEFVYTKGDYKFGGIYYPKTSGLIMNLIEGNESAPNYVNDYHDSKSNIEYYGAFFYNEYTKDVK